MHVGCSLPYTVLGGRRTRTRFLLLDNTVALLALPDLPLERSQLLIPVQDCVFSIDYYYSLPFAFKLLIHCRLILAPLI